MGIVGIGTDLVGTEELGALLAGQTAQLQAIFTGHEIQYCESKHRKAEHYAARLAAKNATCRALGLGSACKHLYREIEVVNNSHGSPRVFVHGRAKALFARNRVRGAAVSLSHSRDHAIAVVILER